LNAAIACGDTPHFLFWKTAKKKPNPEDWAAIE
jgi:hypothetical protein